MFSIADRRGPGQSVTNQNEITTRALPPELLGLSEGVPQFWSTLKRAMRSQSLGHWRVARLGKCLLSAAYTLSPMAPSPLSLTEYSQASIERAGKVLSS